MRCPRCTCEDDKVVDSRSTKEGAGVRRRRECLNCGHRFTTYEGIIQAELKVIKKNDDRREDFDRDKLRHGIELACRKRPVSQEQIDDLVARVIAGLESDFEREVISTEIGNRVMNELKEIDEVSYVRFASVYKKFKDIDQFIDEIRSMGTIR